MKKIGSKSEPILGFDEIFENGIIVDGSNSDLNQIDEVMKKYFSQVNLPCDSLASR